MIGSLFKELPPLTETETEVAGIPETMPFLADGDDSLVVTLPLVQKIVRRKTISSLAQEASDIVQGIALRLLQWRTKYQNRSGEMSTDEWQSFAARTTYNEINRQFERKPSFSEISLDSLSDTRKIDVYAATPVEGQSDTEIVSLASRVWELVSTMTLRQRQALVFGSQELVIYFLRCGISDQELAESLNLTPEKWEEIRVKLPLKSFQIAELLKELGDPKTADSIIRSIKKARYEARTKLRRVTDK